MDAYTYVFMCVYINIYTYTYIHRCIYILIHTHTCIYELDNLMNFLHVPQDRKKRKKKKQEKINVPEEFLHVWVVLPALVALEAPKNGDRTHAV